MTEEITKEDYENFPSCKHCGHPSLSHDEEFGNCTHLPGKYILGNYDGCDCPGYEESEKTDPNPEPQEHASSKFVDHKYNVLLHNIVVAVARSKTMARRIANALNSYKPNSDGR